MRCIPSLLSSISQQDEVIVVDNASSDGSPEWLELTYPQIQLIRSTENLGFGGGNNLGSSYANGSYLGFLNPDTMVEPDWLDELVMVLENESTVGLATSKILLLNNPDRINTCGNDMHISGITCRGMDHPCKAAEPGCEHFAAYNWYDLS
jgi:GT2 family glycosyltransferase